MHRFCEQQAVEGGSGKVANYLRSKYIYDLDVCHVVDTPAVVIGTSVDD